MDRDNGRKAGARTRPHLTERSLRKVGQGWAAGLTLAVIFAAASANAAASTQARVESGLLEGSLEADVLAFRGVPYAAPPVGPNRWRAPQSAPSWQGIRPARGFGASCMQQRTPAFGPYTQEFLEAAEVSEDCLFLNVWTPADRGKKLPVLVWIHGGGFVGGSGAIPIYNGGRLAAKGAVVVTINYRLGIFGYLAHPGLTAEDPRRTSGNYGLQDQIAALKWVQANIRQFGGDPGNVTVMGESGGAVSVSSLLLSPQAGGLFRRAVALSGVAMGYPAPTLSQAEAYGLTVADRLQAKTVAEMRALPADRVLNGVVRPPLGPGGALRFAFWPVVDGVILPEDPNVGAVRPRWPLPLMAGYNADENTIMVAKTAADFERYARTWFGPHADRIIALYPHATDEEAVASAHLLARDRYMTALMLWTDARIRASGQTIYRYLYDHPSPTFRGPSYGAFHTAGLPYLFGVLDPAARPYGPKDLEVSAQLQSYLINFMTRGTPDGSGLRTWPKAAPGDRQVMGLGLKPGPRPAVSSAERFDALRTFADDGGVLSLF